LVANVTDGRDDLFETGKVFGGFLGESEGVVDRVTVDMNDFVFVGGLGSDISQEAGKKHFLVESGDDDGEKR
jgi:hypothetical protein